MGLKKFLSIFAVATLFLFLFIPGSQASSFVWSGDYLQVGVSNSGTLIDDSFITGIKLDPTGTGSFAAAPDYLKPGTPFEFYSIGVGGTYGTAGWTFGNPFGATTQEITILGDDLGITYTSLFSLGGANLQYTQKILLQKNSNIINFSSDIWNTSTTSASVAFARGLDPDQDIDLGGGFATTNTLAAHEVRADGSAALGDYWIKIVDLGINDVLSGVPSISPDWDTNPFNLLALVDNTGVADSTINMAWGFTLAPFTSKEIDYQYVVGATPVPIPPTAYLIASGLIPFIRLRKKRSIFLGGV